MHKRLPTWHLQCISELYCPCIFALSHPHLNLTCGKNLLCFILQVGVGIKEDVQLLQATYGVTISPVLELADLARERAPAIAAQGRGLKKLCGNLLGMEVRRRLRAFLCVHPPCH